MIRKLYVDLSVLGPNFGGVSIYGIRLANELASRLDCEIVAPEYLSKFFEKITVCPSPIYLKNSLISRGPAWRSAARMDYGPNSFIYAPHMRGSLDAGNQAITIHDLIAHLYPTRNFIENRFNSQVLPRLAKRARVLFTVSQSSKREIVEYYGISEDKIAVVPNGIDLSRWRPANKTSEAFSVEYLLIVGANRPYKNTLEVLRQHALWSNRYRLKIVSSRARYGSVLRRAVQEFELGPRVDFIDDISEERLITLYQGCSAVICPSLTEGFGRPALEGLAVGKPVILSDIPPHREIFGDAAILVTPGSRTGWQNAFEELNNHSMIRVRADRGLWIASLHTWRACGERLVEALLHCEPDLGALKLNHGSAAYR